MIDHKSIYKTNKNMFRLYIVLVLTRNYRFSCKCHLLPLWGVDLKWSTLRHWSLSELTPTTVPEYHRRWDSILVRHIGNLIFWCKTFTPTTFTFSVSTNYHKYLSFSSFQICGPEKFLLRFFVFIHIYIAIGIEVRIILFLENVWLTQDYV